MTSHVKRFRRGAIALLVAGCSESTPPDPDAVLPEPIAVTTHVPLTELGRNTYKGFTGGLYDDGSNTPPAAHHAEGIARRNAIVPIDASGAPSATGRIVMISVGLSNTTQ